MAFCDFVVQYDPNKDTGLDITKRILYSIIIKPIKNKKPRVLFIGGDSGEGKSYGALKLQEILLSIQGLELIDYVDDINVFTPLQYPEKLDGLLFDKRLKKINILCMHEAREIVKAKLWYGFMAQAIGDVNAMSRTVKRLCIMIISQFIRDIATDIRYTLNYYCIVRRPLGKRSRLYINVLWKDDRDLEKPKLRKRKLSGYLVYPDGRYRRFVPQYLELSKPSQEVVELFNKKDYESKAGIIKGKINKLIKEIKDDIQEANSKVEAMVDWYLSHTESLHLIGKQRKGKWKVKPDFKELHDLTAKEAANFERQLNEKLMERVDDEQLSDMA